MAPLNRELRVRKNVILNQSLNVPPESTTVGEAINMCTDTFATIEGTINIIKEIYPGNKSRLFDLECYKSIIGAINSKLIRTTDADERGERVISKETKMIIQYCYTGAEEILNRET